MESRKSNLNWLTAFLAVGLFLVLLVLASGGSAWAGPLAQTTTPPAPPPPPPREPGEPREPSEPPCPGIPAGVSYWGGGTFLGVPVPGLPNGYSLNWRTTVPGGAPYLGLLRLCPGSLPCHYAWIQIGCLNCAKPIILIPPWHIVFTLTDAEVVAGGGAGNIKIEQWDGTKWVPLTTILGPGPNQFFATFNSVW